MIYFEKENGFNYNSATDIRSALQTIAWRYIGQNPAIPLTFRGSYGKEFERKPDFRYILDFNKKFPGTPNEYIVKAYSGIWADDASDINLQIQCFAPVEVYCNETRIFKANQVEEIALTGARGLKVPLVKGWNKISLVCKKTNSGFGCVFGTGSMKGMPLNFIIPDGSRAGREGFLYSEPLKNAEEPVNKWLPEEEYDNASKTGQFERIYGLRDNVYGLAWFKGEFGRFGINTYTLTGRTAGRLTLFIDGRQAYDLMPDNQEYGDFEMKITVSGGTHDILIKSYSSASGWGFELNGNDSIKFMQPVPVYGIDGYMIYAGPFGADMEIDIADAQSMNRVFESGGNKFYWRADSPGVYIRPFHEAKTNFGKWNYPLGVTLYGLLRTARALDKKDMFDYVLEHIERCTVFYEYSMWDRAEFGVPGINQQISGIDSLDDCGSFASTMLELMKSVELCGGKEIAGDVADYISNKQARLPDGALYRRNCYSVTMEQTLWADDLYMSTPFLCKYYWLTDENTYIDDAVNQFRQYKKYLYMPERGCFSHLYHFGIGAPTCVPWGRGNGWVLFSLSELLEYMPEDHEARGEMEELFSVLCEGYLALQDDDGMWHQVLDDSDSYPESSCTSMFVYAFGRGIRFGWLKDTDRYYTAICKAWEALTKISIDKFGNVYGVCRGSGYSYTPSYYKNDLTWLLNDTHGTGIIMLAGLEALKLKEMEQ